MKIVVLGNGFDRASGLKTSYKEFFEAHSNIVEKCEKLIKNNNEKKFPFLEDVEEDIGKYFILNNRAISEKAENDIKNIINKNVQEVRKNIYKDIVSSDLNFWFFYFHGNKKDRNWYDVEQDIKELITNVEKITEIEKAWNPFRMISFNFFGTNRTRDILESNKKKISKDLLYNINEREKKLLYYKLILSKHDGVDLFTALMNELEEFEEIFKNYIYGQYISITKFPDINFPYLNNFLRLADNLDKEYYIINFNYTSVKKCLEVGTPKKYNINENNVHGRYDSKVIFGIDQEKIDEGTYQFSFTKTYRKIKEMNQINTFSLPVASTVDEIVFFGHSLSNADYSYFQSLFDYINLYSSHIRLVFRYGLFGEDETEQKKNEKKYWDAVLKLLRKYANSLDNSAHGENLIHKLILENRLVIKEVKLNNIFE